MPSTGGGNPLPTQVGCRWCEYQTPEMRSNGGAMARLETHVREAHSTEYAEARARGQTRQLRPRTGAMSAD